MGLVTAGAPQLCQQLQGTGLHNCEYFTCFHFLSGIMCFPLLVQQQQQQLGS